MNPEPRLLTREAHLELAKVLLSRAHQNLEHAKWPEFPRDNLRIDHALFELNDAIDAADHAANFVESQNIARTRPRDRNGLRSQ